MSGAVIVYHKHPTSARTLFLRFDYHSIVGVNPMPTLTCLADEPAKYNDDEQKALMDEVMSYLGLGSEELLLDEEFDATVETPKGVENVYLLKVKAMDPPFDKAEQQGGKFVALTETRDLPDYELLLLQRAYKSIMEG